jgi:hypothetical protein
MHSLVANNAGVTTVATMRAAESADLLDARKAKPRRSRAVRGMLFLRQDEQCSNMRLGHSKQPRHARKAGIDPAVKAWIDNVIVPALLERWASNKPSGVAV